jgi:large subunit ribosomal protein L21
MYAVIRAGGGQTTVREGETIQIDRIPGNVGNEVVFDQVLFVHGEGGVTVGKPRVESAQVVGEIVAQMRGPKIRVYRFKKRKGFSKTKGHRQSFTRVRIKEIKH